MDISAIRDEAPRARRQLMEGVERRCLLFGIGKDAAIGAETVGGRVLSTDERRQRRELLDLQHRIGHEALVERAAYTWFDRLLAIRFMEANDRLPSHVRILSARDGSFDPECLHEALDLPLSALDQTKVAGLVAAGDDELLFRAIFLAQCEELADCMPSVFDRVGSAMELLLPDGLLAEGGVVEGLVTSVPDADWTQGVEIVGWAYQFYVSERKDEYFNAKRKATRLDIAPATQLFTPEWIVRYLAENSLGRLWMLNHPNSSLTSSMEYYIAPDGDQASDFRRVGSPEEITVIDPACGSGHMLTHCFDLLTRMYEESGYRRRDIPGLILRRNLTGVEIDPRAASLASFALTMKACEIDPRFLTRSEHVSPHVVCLEAVDLTSDELEALPATLELNASLDTLRHLDEAGSLWEPTSGDAEALAAVAEQAERESGLFAGSAVSKLQKAHCYARVLSQSYDCVIANPPYMGSGNMNAWLSEWIGTHYKEEKGDFCTSFIKRGLDFARQNGYVAEVTMQSWMFLSSYEKMRKWIIDHKGIITMAHLGAHAFDAIGGEVVQTTATVFSNDKLQTRGAYVRLVDYPNEAAKASALCEAVADSDCNWFYRADAENFKSIPGWPIAYWASKSVLNAFKDFKPLKDIALPRQGLATGDNDRFLRAWWEVALKRICFGSKTREVALTSRCKWFPMSKGGEYRKWYGNIEYVVNWEHDGEEIRHFVWTEGPRKGKLRSRPQNMDTYFHPYVGWSAISSGAFAMRYYPEGFIANAKGPGCFASNSGTLEYVLALMNSSTVQTFLRIVSPTLDYSQGPIGRIPVRLEKDDSQIQGLVEQSVLLARADWDSFEVSWDFKTHPLAQSGEPLIEEQFERWSSECQDRFDTLKANEEELNRIFAHIYHVEGEVPVEVSDEKIAASARLASREREVKSLISYAVGCMLGRYSLDVPGLVLANQGDGIDEYLSKVPTPTFMPDADGILPITDDEYFDDDVVAMFVRFLGAAYGIDSQDANLKYVADSLGGNESPKKVIRDYFTGQFYADHCRTYQKRPIYWMISSGPKGGFRALFYIHRYTPDLLARVRTDYVHEQQERYRSRISELERQRDGAARGQVVAMDRELRSLRAKLEETNGFEERLHHLADQMVEIDLDDGVKVNYERLRDVLARIR